MHVSGLPGQSVSQMLSSVVERARAPEESSTARQRTSAAAFR